MSDFKRVKHDSQQDFPHELPIAPRTTAAVSWDASIRLELPLPFAGCAVVAKAADTSVQVIESNYGRFIVSHADKLLRDTLFDPAPGGKIVSLPRRG